jgi:hypothetical protein
MFSYELDAVFELNFFLKSCECRRWLTLGRAVEMNIFADLTISKRQK